MQVSKTHGGFLEKRNCRIYVATKASLAVRERGLFEKSASRTRAKEINQHDSEKYKALGNCKGKSQSPDRGTGHLFGFVKC